MQGPEECHSCLSPFFLFSVPKAPFSASGRGLGGVGREGQEVRDTLAIRRGWPVLRYAGVGWMPLARALRCTCVCARVCVHV